MKRLLTIMILAPMFAGAQTTDSAWKTAKIDTMYSNGYGVYSTDSAAVWMKISNSYFEVTDTVPRKMLVVDTCNNGSMVVFVNGYVVRKYRKPSVSWEWQEYPKIVAILNGKKKPMHKCLAVWQTN